MPNKQKEQQIFSFKKLRSDTTPKIWTKAKTTIRHEEHLKLDYQNVDFISPTKGKHRFSHCQMLYEEVHEFLSNRKWALVKEDSEVPGITWIDLFALFDITGSRTERGQHQKDPEATKRAGKMRGTSRCAKAKKGNISDILVITKPTLDDELKLFKAIVRHVTRHEVKNGKGNMHRGDNRASLRRLNDLGVSGHQPAIMAFCQMAKREKTKITEAILKQKLPTTRKQKSSSMNSSKEKQERESQHKPPKLSKNKATGSFFALQG